jgi:hypothetical protein
MHHVICYHMVPQLDRGFRLGVDIGGTFTDDGADALDLEDVLDAKVTVGAARDLYGLAPSLDPPPSTRLPPEPCQTR